MDALAENSEVFQQTQEALVKTHAVLVKRIAYHLLHRLPPCVQLDDLIQAGMLGLLEAVRHYDASKGASFETYAGIRIRGHMLDEVRQNDWVPRSVYHNSKIIAKAVKLLENKLGRDVKDVEVAEELDISLNQYHEMLQDSVSSRLYGFDDLGVTDDILFVEGIKDSTEPHANILHSDLKKRITETMERLPHKERMVLFMYYQHDLNLKEIGDIFEVSESRISQILTQGTERIKSRLAE